MKARGWIRRGDTLTRGSADKDRRTVAVHEAAHAVVAHRMGERVQQLHLVRAKPMEGWTKIDYGVRRGRRDPITFAVIALAGHEAEHRFYGRPIGLLPPGDFKAVIDVGCSNKSANLVGWLARQHVKWFERDIRRVQKELLRRGSLTRRQFLAALRVAA